jgi:predicted TIM-barrel fold metal-dependent hydrolase
MIQCGYIYCGASFDPGESHCPRCGCAWREGLSPATKLLHAIPPVITDMHQVLPRIPEIGELQIRYMQQLGIQKALLQSVPDKIESLCNNSSLREIKQQYGKAFIISQFMDPRHPFAKKKIKAYAKQGCAVIKLLPCLGYYPDDKKFSSFWALMEELGLIAMVHTGFITARHKAEEKKHNTYLHSRYCDPLYFDILCRKFPKLTVILCHTGSNIWYESACQLISQHEHVWGDVSGFGNEALSRILQLNIPVNMNKLFWGNDSHPQFYHTNLNILCSLLHTYNAGHLLMPLLNDNAVSFIHKYMPHELD